MSQEKVDQYKKYKENKKKILKREKLMKRLEFTAIGVVCLAFVGWFGFSIYSSATKASADEVTTTEVDINAFNDYLNNLSAETAE